MTTATPTLEDAPAAPAVGIPLYPPVRRLLPEHAVENDCEDQGFSDVSDGCNKWPCRREPLVRWRLGWRCTKCGGCY
jgi:hypothetical protein